MPYLLGTNAIRRTIPYLQRGKLLLRENVKIMIVHYNDDNGSYHEGARDFVHWNLPQVFHRNPDVQVLFYKNMFPTPFIRCWLDNGEDVIMDVFNKSNEDIMNHLVKTLGRAEIQTSDIRKEVAENLPKFGPEYKRHCLCEIPGQVPCPQIVTIPEHMTGKYKYENNLLPPKGQERA